MKVFNKRFPFWLKTILGIALIEMFFLAILVMSSQSILQRAINSDINRQAQSISILLASSLLDSVISGDVATSQSIIESAMNIPGTVYIKVLDIDAHIIAEIGDQTLLDRTFSPDSKVGSAGKVFDLRSEIAVDGYKFGVVEVGISVESQLLTIAAATKKLSIIALLELVLVALFSLLLGLLLTRRIRLLQEAALKISKGEVNLNLPSSGHDEIADAAKAFNQMSKRLQLSTAKLKSDKARIDAIMNTVTDGVFMVDTNGVIIAINESASGTFNEGINDITGQKISSYIPDLCFRDAQNNRFLNWQKIKGQDKFGNEVPLEIHANEMDFEDEKYIVAVMRDLTDINRLQYELSTILTFSPDGYLMLSPDMTVSYANAALYEMLSIENDLTGKSWDCFKQQLQKQLNRTFHDNVAFLDEILVESTLYLSKPTQKVLRCYRRKIDEQSSNSAEILYFHDITHESIVDKMKSEFLATAAHELRTPLAGVMGYSELLSVREYPSEKTKEIASSINRQSTRLKLLLDELLDLSSIENGAIAPITFQKGTLKQALTECCNDFDGNDKFHYIVMKLADHWPIVEHEPLKIRQIITNLLSNAYKYSPDNAEITASTSISVEGGVNEFGITIKDKGIGMTPEQLSHFGERFYRADTSGKVSGTGLGVALTIALIELHNGRLEIESTFGEGTAVTIWFPIMQTPEEYI